MIPPCIFQKCLLYPACRNKRDIECDILRTFYHVTVVANSTTSTTNPSLSKCIWESLKKTLPNMSSLKGNILP